jgi:hypothetical protein
VRLTAGSASMMALQAPDWGDGTESAVVARPSPTSRKPSRAMPAPTSSLIRHHETQAA